MSLNSSRDTEARGDSREEPAFRRQSLFRRHAWLAIILPLWVAVGFYLSQFIIAGLVIGLRFGGVPLDEANMAVLNAVMAALVYLLTAVIVIGLPGLVRKSRTTLKDVGLDRLPAWQDILLALAGFVIYVICAGVLITLAGKVIPGFDAGQAQEIGFENLAKRYEYVLAFVTLVVIAPVAEEILMRGYLYGKLRRIIGVIAAMIITGAFFGVLHLQWNVAIDVFALSLVLTSLREVTGSIWSSILVHMMKNGLAFYLLFINPTLLNTIGG